MEICKRYGLTNAPYNCSISALVLNDTIPTSSTFNETLVQPDQKKQFDGPSSFNRYWYLFLLAVRNKIYKLSQWLAKSTYYPRVNHLNSRSLGPAISQHSHNMLSYFSCQKGSYHIFLHLFPCHLFYVIGKCNNHILLLHPHHFHKIVILLHSTW